MIKRSEIFDYAHRTYKVKPDYPFGKHPRYAVLRHTDNDRWFGLVMNVPKDRLGLKGGEAVEIVDVKCRPEKVDYLKTKPGFRPAYHMNKAHWLTVLLDGPVSKDEVLALLDESYALTK